MRLALKGALLAPKPEVGGAAGQWLTGRWTGPSPQPPALGPWPAHPGPLCLCPRLPSGLEDVSKYPDLIAELLRRQWTEAEVRGALAENLLRVFEAVEQVRSCLLHPAPPRAGHGRAANLCLSPGKRSHANTRGGAHPAGQAGGFLQDHVRLLRGPQPPPPAGDPAGLPRPPPLQPVSSVTPWGPTPQALKPGKTRPGGGRGPRSAAPHTGPRPPGGTPWSARGAGPQRALNKGSDPGSPVGVCCRRPGPGGGSLSTPGQLRATAPAGRPSWKGRAGNKALHGRCWGGL